MSILSVNIGNFFNKGSMARASRASTLRIKKGQIGSNMTSKGVAAVNVSKMQARLEKNGMMKKQANLTGNKLDTNELSKDILTAMGISCVTDKMVNIPNYSLLSGQTDAETVDNPNKIERKIFKSLKSGKVSFRNVLKDDSLPFYKFDERPSEMYTNEQNEFDKKDKSRMGYDYILSEIVFNSEFSPAPKMKIMAVL